MSDEPQKTPDERIRLALRGLEMLSFGSTQAWNASGGHSEDPSGRIVTVILRADEPPHLSYRRRYNSATTDRARLEVVEEAEGELKAWKVRQKVVEASVSIEELIITDDVGFSPEMIAARRNVHADFVRRLRAKSKKSTEDGTPLVPGEIKLDDAEKIARAKELRERGLSLRQIGMHLDVGVATVSRYLSRASV